MSDETFFREVNEEIRQQRVHELWRRFGRLLLAAAVAIVLIAVAYVAWREYQSRAANASGDRFIAAVDLAEAGTFDKAVPELEALAKDGAGAYPELAELRLASIRERQGDSKAALEAFDKVANDTNVPRPIRDIAAVRAAYVLVDTGSLDDVRARVERLSDDGAPLRALAREAIGLSAWKAGNLDEARRLLTQNRDDATAPSGVTLRSRVLLDLVEAGTTPASAAEAAAAQPAPEAPLPLPDSPIPLDLGVPSPTLPAPTDAEPESAAPAAPAPPPSADAPAVPAQDAAPTAAPAAPAN